MIHGSPHKLQQVLMINASSELVVIALSLETSSPISGSASSLCYKKANFGQFLLGVFAMETVLRDPQSSTNLLDPVKNKIFPTAIEI